MRLTVGPLPPAVYWRRRAIVLSGVLLALFLVAQACLSASASPDQTAGTGPTGSPTPPRAVTTTTPSPAAPTNEPSGTPSGGPATVPASGSSATPVDPNACTDAELEITAEADQTEFTSGTSVQFTIRIRNGANRTCSRDIGGNLRELFLRAGTSGGKVWSSRDCDAPTGTEVKDLTPGFATAYWVAWSGRASDSCDGPEPAGELVPPGSYELVARLGTAYGDPLPITIQS